MRAPSQSSASAVARVSIAAAARCWRRRRRASAAAEDASAASRRAPTDSSARDARSSWSGSSSTRPRTWAARAPTISPSHRAASASSRSHSSRAWPRRARSWRSHASEVRWPVASASAAAAARRAAAAVVSPRATAAHAEPRWVSARRNPKVGASDSARSAASRAPSLVAGLGEGHGQAGLGQPAGPVEPDPARPDGRPPAASGRRWSAAPPAARTGPAGWRPTPG